MDRIFEQSDKIDAGSGCWKHPSERRSAERPADVTRIHAGSCVRRTPGRRPLRHGQKIEIVTRGKMCRLVKGSKESIHLCPFCSSNLRNLRNLWTSILFFFSSPHAFTMRSHPAGLAGRLRGTGLNFSPPAMTARPGGSGPGFSTAARAWPRSRAFYLHCRQPRRER